MIEYIYHPIIEYNNDLSYKQIKFWASCLKDPFYIRHPLNFRDNLAFSVQASFIYSFCCSTRVGSSLIPFFFACF